MSNRFFALSAVLAAALTAAATVGCLAGPRYPERTVKIVVPVPPGGTADILPRLVAAKLAARWGQAVIVENRPGAALDLGAEAVAKAAADGYTLLATPPGPLVTNQFLQRNLGFDPAAFVPVTVLAKSPFLLVARPTLPVSTLKELLAYAKANPDKLTFASSGVGSPPHLAMAMLMTEAGVHMVHVPYKGLTPALTDVISGHIDLMFHDPASTLQQIRSGQLKVLGVSSETRIHELPDVPSISEILSGFHAVTWYGVVAPPKTPSGIADELSKAMAEVMRRPDVEKQMSSFSIVPVGSSPAETADFLMAETKRWRGVVAAAGLQPR